MFDFSEFVLPTKPVEPQAPRIPSGVCATPGAFRNYADALERHAEELAAAEVAAVEWVQRREAELRRFNAAALESLGIDGLPGSEVAVELAWSRSGQDLATHPDLGLVYLYLGDFASVMTAHGRALDKNRGHYERAAVRAVEKTAILTDPTLGCALVDKGKLVAYFGMAEGMAVATSAFTAVEDGLFDVLPDKVRSVGQEED